MFKNSNNIKLHISNQYLIYLLLLVALLRIIYVFLYFQHSESSYANKIWSYISPKSLKDSGSTMLQSDAVYYDILANQFANGEGLEYTDEITKEPMVFSPGYPVFLGVVYFISGRGLINALIVNVILDILTAVLIVLTFRLYYNDIKCEILFLIFYAFYLPIITITIMPLTESLFMFLMAIFFYMLVYSIKYNSVLYSIFSGIILGFATLTRPVTLLFGLFLLFIELVKFKRINKARFKTYLLVSIFAFLVIFPWTLKNYLLYDKIILVNSNSGIANTGTDLKSSGGEIKDELRNLKEKNEGKKDILMITKDIASNPVEYAKLFLIKFIRLWLNIGFPDSPSVGSIITSIFQSIIIIFFIYTIFNNNDIFKYYYPAILFVLYLTILHVILFSAKIRFIIPIMPYILLIFSVGVIDVFKSISLFKKSK